MSPYRIVGPNPVLEDRDTLGVTLLKHSCSMNRLSRAERAQIIRCLVEGDSLRSTTRLTGRSINTVTKLLVELGAACEAYQIEHLRDLTSTRIECDEIWAFVRAKNRNVPEEHRGEPGWGDIWTWVAHDPDTKLVSTWLVGQRDADCAIRFLNDLAGRLRYRVQLTTDGHGPYLPAVESAFGIDVDYAMLVKFYGTDPAEDRKFSPPVVLAEEVRIVQGDPDRSRISTSGVETAIERNEKQKGYVIAFSFGRGAHEEVARARAKMGLDIELVPVQDLLDRTHPLAQEPATLFGATLAPPVKREPETLPTVEDLLTPQQLLRTRG